MSPDVISRLRTIDPAGAAVAVPEDLLAELLAQPRPAPRRSRRPLLALAGVCAVAAAAVALPGGTTDARAELLAAARKTAAFTSGQVDWRIVTDPPLADFHSETAIHARFDGAESELRFVPGGEHSGLSSENRVVGGRSYSRIGNAPWKQDRSAPTGSRFQDELAVADALAGIVKAAPEVQRDGDTFHARVDAAALPVYSMGGPKWPAGSVDVDVTIADDGTVSEMDLHVPAQRWDVRFAELGEPQGITAP